MRTTQKRKRSNGAFRFVKRRRFIKSNRFKRKSRNTITQTSRQEWGTNPFRYRAKKLSKKAWRRALWNQTRFKTHFKTVLAVTDNLGTPNNVTLINPWISQALSTVQGLEFWHSLGGLQDPSFGEIPSWANAVESNDPITTILRGGRLWITTSLGLGGVDTCKVRVQLVFAKQQARNVSDSTTSNTIGQAGVAGGYVGTTGLNLFGPGFGAGTGRPIGWDITQAPDWEQYFYKPIVDKSFDIKAGDSITTFWKVKPVKIDLGPFKDNALYSPYWFVYAGQDNNSNGTAETFVVTFGHNMSFAVADTFT